MLRKSIRQDLVNQLRAQEVGRDHAGQGAELNDVAGDDGCPGDGGAEKREDLVPGETARFGGAGCRLASCVRFLVSRQGRREQEARPS